jgi:hypothetical protein
MVMEKRNDGLSSISAIVMVMEKRNDGLSSISAIVTSS